ncbi:MAG TPA: hypothetical protein VG675_08580 [Bryobacteraceae bacterium]|nr:hypothetical protein [Bryobacteraceae bacterium]
MISCEDPTEQTSSIHFEAGVLDEIRRQSVDGLRAFGHGGLEIGGVLYGVREGDGWRIAASAAVECEHALGPGFALSSNDERLLEQRLTPPEGLELAGWYCSHTRSELQLNLRDLAIFTRFFGPPGLVALIVKPYAEGGAQAALYLKDEGTPHQTFVIPRPVTAPAETKIGQAATAEPAPTEPGAVQDHLPVLVTAAPPVPRRKSAGTGWIYAASLATVLISAFAFFGLLHHKTPASPPSSQAAPQLNAYTVAPGQVCIVWDHVDAPADATGSIDIEDGPSHVRLPLDAGRLRAGNITYAMHSRRINIALWVAKTRDAVPVLIDATQFVGGPFPSAQAATASDTVTTTATAEAVPPLETAAATENIASNAPPRFAPAKNTTLEDKTDKSGADRAAPVRRFLLPATRPTPRTQQSASMLPEPPSPVYSPAAESVAVPLSIAPVLRHEPIERPPSAPSYSGPRVGRIIWTGSLAQRGVVEIQGGQAQPGTIAGALPGVPINFRVSPAEFKSGGLVIYTSDAAINGRKEAAGRANGWNATEFVWEPARAKLLATLEAPNASNDFRRLVLRSEMQSCDVIVIDWWVSNRR